MWPVLQRRNFPCQLFSPARNCQHTPAGLSGNVCFCELASYCWPFREKLEINRSTSHYTPNEFRLLALVHADCRNGATVTHVIRFGMFMCAPRCFINKHYLIYIKFTFRRTIQYETMMILIRDHHDLTTNVKQVLTDALISVSLINT